MRASIGFTCVVSAAVVLVALAFAGFALGANGNPPSITVITASAGTGGGKVVTITGLGFAHVTAVKIGKHALSFTVVSPTEITANVPPTLVKTFANAATFTVLERVKYAYHTIKWTYTGTKNCTSGWLGC